MMTSIVVPGSWGRDRANRCYMAYQLSVSSPFNSRAIGVRLIASPDSLCVSGQFDTEGP
jgi:hypothetical protein